MKRTRLNILFALISGFFVLGSFHTSAQQNPMDPSSTSYLFIGNSFTYMNEMPKLFDAIATNAGKNVYVKSDTKGGANFEEHSNRPSVYKSIRSHKWDNVILQGYSREFIHAASYVDSATVPYLNKILDSIYANNPCTNVYFFMTWGYEEGFGGYEYTKDYEGMADTIHGGYLRIGEHYQLPVVPVGKVWKNVKTSSRAKLYIHDKFHPNIRGSYLAASTFFSAFYDEENENFRPKGVSKKWGKFIANEAYEWVHNNREMYSLDQQESLVSWKYNVDGTVNATFHATYPNTLSYKWVINESDTINGQSGNFVFSDDSPGTIELVVTSECGTRKYWFSVPMALHRDGRLTRREKRLLKKQ